jgi:gas vesicle protein
MDKRSKGKIMKNFKQFREALKNPYKGMAKSDLKRKLDSFVSQHGDLISKSKGRTVKRIEPEIRDMETKIQQIRQLLGIKR